MKKTMAEEVQEIITRLEKDYSFNDYITIDEGDLADMTSSSEVIEHIRTMNEDRVLTDSEIIYHATAIKYLAENDPSLMESMELAADMGYETKDLNSELLASLLSTQENEQDFEKFLDRLEEELDDFILDEEEEEDNDNTADLSPVQTTDAVLPGASQ